MEVVVVAISITAILLSLLTIAVHTILYTRQVQLHHSTLQVQSEIVKDTAEFGNRMYQLLGRIEGKLTSVRELPDSQLQQLIQAAIHASDGDAARSNPKSQAAHDYTLSEIAPRLANPEPSVSAAPPPAASNSVSRAEEAAPRRQEAATTPPLSEMLAPRPSQTAASVPQPQIILGRVMIDGQQAPPNTAVKVVVKGKELARTTTKSEGFYQLSVPSPIMVARPESSELQFLVEPPGEFSQPREAPQRLLWSAGEVTELILNV